MADMITREDLIKFKAQYPGVPVVAYVNTTAEVKAESDVCCTSANAVNVVRALNVPRILCVPDQHLAKYIQSQIPEVEVIWWNGFCPTHLRMHPEDVVALKKEYPEAMILAHPECDDPIKDMADFIGSTTKIRETAMKSDRKVFIVCTEDGVRARLSEDCPDKLFLTPTRACAVCPNMKLTRLENIRNTLRDMPLEDEIIIPEEIAVKARKTLDLMMEIHG
jgi:quinolinate synthase